MLQSLENNADENFYKLRARDFKLLTSLLNYYQRCFKHTLNTKTTFSEYINEIMHESLREGILAFYNLTILGCATHISSLIEKSSN